MLGIDNAEHSAIVLGLLRPHRAEEAHPALLAAVQQWAGATGIDDLSLARALGVRTHDPGVAGTSPRPSGAPRPRACPDGG